MRQLYLFGTQVSSYKVIWRTSDWIYSADVHFNLAILKLRWIECNSGVPGGSRALIPLEAWVIDKGNMASSNTVQCLSIVFLISLGTCVKFGFWVDLTITIYLVTKHNKFSSQIILKYLAPQHLLDTCCNTWLKRQSKLKTTCNG